LQLEAIVSPKKGTKIPHFIEYSPEEPTSSARLRARTENSLNPTLNKKPNNEVSLMMGRMMEVSNLDEKTKNLTQNLQVFNKELKEIARQIESCEKKNWEDKKLNKKIEKFLRKFFVKILNQGIDTRYFINLN